MIRSRARRLAKEALTALPPLKRAWAAAQLAKDRELLDKLSIRLMATRDVYNFWLAIASGRPLLDSELYHLDQEMTDHIQECIARRAAKRSQPNPSPGQKEQKKQWQKTRKPKQLSLFPEPKKAPPSFRSRGKK